MKNLKSGKHLYAIYFEMPTSQNETPVTQNELRITQNETPVTQSIIFVRRIRDFDKTNKLFYFIKKIY